MPDFNKTAEDAIGRVAKDLLDNALVTGSISKVMEAREKAVALQEFTMSNLNVPTAADIERLTRRVRSISQRLEGIEDAIDRLAESSRTDKRLSAIEAQLTEIAAALAVKA